MRRAFSLIEILMAIFILGVGVISIAALLPAGIVQQRRATDDVMGPVVANNALALLQSRLKQTDFGTFEDWTAAADLPNAMRPPYPTMWGDWGWIRPTHLFSDWDQTSEFDETGSIDVFGWHRWIGSGVTLASEFPGGYTDAVTGLGNGSLTGVPWALEPGIDAGDPAQIDFFSPPPRVVISREERFFPQGTQRIASTSANRPLYVWDCMFRRFQDRVLVAIFVFRATAPGDERAAYTTIPNPSNPDVPPLPVALEIATAAAPDPAWDRFQGRPSDPVLGTDPCSDYDPFDAAQSWQEAGQWLVDQNNNVHRVLYSYCDDPGAARRVELVNPVPANAALGVEHGLPPFNGAANVVAGLWYIPTFVNDPATGAEYRLEPVYVLVKEL